MVNQSGFRSSVRYQSHSNKSLTINGVVNRNIDSSAAAFICSNFVLYDKRKRPVTYSVALDLSSISYCDTCWRYQKKKNNCDIISYERNDLKPAHCYIMTVLYLLVQADRLDIHVYTSISLAMVGTKKRNILFYITSMTVTRHLQAPSKASNVIKTTRTLARSTHSVSVGACVLMNAADEKVHHITKMFRWKSDKCMDYIHSITRLATKHNNFITKAVVFSMAS